MQLRLFGGIELSSLASQTVRLPTRKTVLLLAALALAGPRGARRELLGAGLWADRADAQVRNSLRQGLAAIRQGLAASGGALRLDGDAEVVRLEGDVATVDSWLFDRLVEASEADGLARAAELWRGDLLAGVPLPEPLDQSLQPHQRRYRQKALELVERLSQIESGDAVIAERSCEALAERLLAADPAAEEAHRALIRLRLRHGHATAARRQFELCREALRRDLGAEPEAATAALLAAPSAELTPPAEPISVPTTAVASPPPEVPSGRHRDRPSLIVMPFDNLSGAADDYFVDGVVEEVTAALSQVRDFFVIARLTAFTYKGRLPDVREIGRELGVDYLVEGTVRRGGDRLRISVQLVDSESRAQLWSDRYEGTTGDVFAFQDRIAAQVAGAIRPAVRNAEIEITRRKPPGSLRAYDFVLRAYPKIWAQTMADNAEAIELLTQAIAVDPAYGRAHALIAWCHAQSFIYIWADDAEAARRAAIDAVAAASGLIADDPTALTAVGAAITQCTTDWDRAATFIRAALDIDPNNAWAWARQGWVEIHRVVPDAARECFERSLVLNPRDPLELNLRVGIAMSVAFRGGYAEAGRMIREAMHKSPNVAWPNRQLAYVLAEAGDLDGAREAMARLRAAHPNISIAMMRVCHPYRHTGALFDRMVKVWRDAGMPETATIRDEVPK